MKTVIKYLMTLSLLCGAFGLGNQIVSSAEMDVDVGIEFTEVEPEPEPPIEKDRPRPEPPIVKPKPNPPRLPQTGEKLNKNSMLVGGVLIVGAGLLLRRRGKEVKH